MTYYERNHVSGKERTNKRTVKRILIYFNFICQTEYKIILVTTNSKAKVTHTHMYVFSWCMRVLNTSPAIFFGKYNLINYP